MCALHTKFWWMYYRFPGLGSIHATCSKTSRMQTCLLKTSITQTNILSFWKALRRKQTCFPESMRILSNYIASKLRIGSGLRLFMFFMRSLTRKTILNSNESGSCVRNTSINIIYIYTSYQFRWRLIMEPQTIEGCRQWTAMNLYLPTCSSLKDQFPALMRPATGHCWIVASSD